MTTKVKISYDGGGSVEFEWPVALTAEEALRATLDCCTTGAHMDRLGLSPEDAAAAEARKLSQRGSVTVDSIRARIKRGTGE
jgi:hypothetical protein